jgi:hypothetical protein
MGNFRLPGSGTNLKTQLNQDKKNAKNGVVDPHLFNADPDPVPVPDPHPNTRF